MTSISDHLSRNARRTPDREALRFGDHVWTWRELDADVDRIAAALAARGVVKGDRVALMAPNGDAFVRTAYAALRLGALLVPVNARFAPPEVAHVVRDAGAQLLLVAATTATAAVVARRDARRRDQPPSRHRVEPR